MRKAFSMVTALIVIVVMALVAQLVFSMSGKIIKSTSYQYMHEQAELLAKSYTELAILAVINHQRTAATGCIRQINGVVNGLVPGGPVSGSSLNGSGFDVRTRIYYIGNDLDKSNIGNIYWLNRNTPIVTDYNTSIPASQDSVAAIIVDVYVRYKDPDAADSFRAFNGTNPTASSIPWITYHRRTLQKI